MTKPLTPDLCIIGAGSAGLSVAVVAGGLGVPAILVEKGAMGGECLNAGCVPSKALLAAAHAVHSARLSAPFGLPGSRGWQWTAGCGADAAPCFRIFNPVLQSRRFDPQGGYLRRWQPELARLPHADLHAPWQAEPAVLAAAGVRLGRDYPRPVVDFPRSRDEALAALKRIGKG